MEKQIVRSIDDKNRVVIPPELLKEVGLEQGDYVIIKRINGKLQLIKANITEGQ